MDLRSLSAKDVMTFVECRTAVKGASVQLALAERPRSGAV